MRFHLSDEQLAVQDSVAHLLDRELDPQRLLAIFDSAEGHDPELWRALGKLGVFSIPIPESHGGLGLSMLDLAVVAEILGNRAAPGPFLGHVLATYAIAEGGTDEQKDRWLPQLARGERIGTVALAESGERWQPEEWQMARGETLSGGKSNVPFASQADVMVVGVAGGGLMLADSDPERLSFRTITNLDGTRRIAHVTLDRLPAEPLALAGGRLRDAALVLLAADAFGGARRCLDMAVQYALTREQFNTIIGRFQALKHQLANVAVDVEPARGLYWYAAHAFDQLPAEAERMAATAKAHLTDRFVQAARDATEAHGGIGYTWEYPLHVWLKRAVFDRAFMGAPSVHRRRIARMSGWAAATG
jgi:alkylation response protein AidB-like acyl-CoA dehydrogenase